MFNTANQAIEIARETLSGVVIETLDSSTATIAEGFVALAAARAAAMGKNLTEVTEAAKSVIQRVNLFVALDTLHYLVRGGRVPKAAAWASSLLQIKPVLTVADGEAHLVTNPRTTAGAMNRILQIMEQKVVRGQPLHVAVTHADALDKAIALRNQISSQFDCAELLLTEFTPVMGAHTGPGVIGVAFYNGD